LELFEVIIAGTMTVLILALVYTVVTDVKGVLGGIMVFSKPDIDPVSWLLFPIWLLIWTIDKSFGLKLAQSANSKDNLNEEKYKSNKNLSVAFTKGRKMIYVQGIKCEYTKTIEEFTEFAQGQYVPSEFVLSATETLLTCPENISYYDFNILVQHFNNTHGNEVYGLYLSDELGYYLQQDENSLHNLVGSTFEGQKFSVYTLDDLDKKVYLRLNDQIDIQPFDTEKLKKHYTTSAM